MNKIVKCDKTDSLGRECGTHRYGKCDDEPCNHLAIRYIYDNSISEETQRWLDTHNGNGIE
jgi:hypothetical protein